MARRGGDFPTASACTLANIGLLGSGAEPGDRMGACWPEAAVQALGATALADFGL